VTPGPRVPCRNCRSAGLRLLYSFGELPLGGYLLPTAALAQQAPRFVNALAICRACGLVQQAFDSARESLIELVYSNYQPTYSMSAAVRAYQGSFLDAAVRLSCVAAGDAVIEIGSNDGYVLGLLNERGLSPVGFDPSIAPAVGGLGYRVFREYFGAESARRYVGTHGTVKLVISRHTLEHAFEPLDFVEGIGAVLAPDGVALIEVPYLQLQMANNQFQSMGVQHVCFFTLDSLAKMLGGIGLQVRDAWFCQMDGGSIVVCAHKRRTAGGDSELVARIEAVERTFRLHEAEGFGRFFAEVDQQRTEIRAQMAEFARSGRQIVAYGAGGKGQALLNLLELDTLLIPYVIDDTPGYAGKYVPGVGTEVVARDDPRAGPASMVLITAPTHIREIVQRDRETKGRDRLYVVTAPRLHIADA
jgi:SAM-dependent methyltransferase